MVREIAAMLKAIHASEDTVAARDKAMRVIEKLRGFRLTRAAELVEVAVEDTDLFTHSAREHWRRIRTNNPIERILHDIRRPPGRFGRSQIGRHVAGTTWSWNDQQMRGAITA